MKNFSPVLTVSALTGAIKRILEGSFGDITVEGEISNFKPHSSGHWYFSLKDSGAQIDASIWRSNTSRVTFQPVNGMKVIVTGKLTVWEPAGKYKIDVRTMHPQGKGDLHLAFEALKAKLSAEGLFDGKDKKPVNKTNSVIGIVTSDTSAALQDMLNVARRRFPLMQIIVYPALMQGAGAAESVKLGIETLNKIDGVEVIIVARGGGSIEDLWAFNEEAVARAIFASAKPVVTGIGHETDFTIADFVADHRASTPTAAMEMLTPDMQVITNFLTETRRTMHESVASLITRQQTSVNSLINSYSFRSSGDLLGKYAQRLDMLEMDIRQKWENIYTAQGHRLQLLREKLELHNVNRTLEAGFVYIKQQNKIIKKSTELNEVQPFSITFVDGVKNILPESRQ